MQKPHAFIFIGRSGCGKGTQVKLLKSILEEKTPLSVEYIETGDMFRSFIKGDTYSSKLSYAVYEKDERQPDFLACHMWSKALLEDMKGDSHVIFDGVSRSVPEAQLLNTALTFYGFEKVHVIHLDVSREWSEKHLLARGRSDDASMDRITKRLNWFETDVVPAIEYYRHSDQHFISVQGEQSIESVHQDIMKALPELI
jgi:adenylate kinase family enzyme